MKSFPVEFGVEVPFNTLDGFIQFRHMVAIFFVRNPLFFHQFILQCLSLVF
jgi:hypothetical protein